MANGNLPSAKKNAVAVTAMTIERKLLAMIEARDGKAGRMIPHMAAATMEPNVKRRQEICRAEYRGVSPLMRASIKVSTPSASTTRTTARTIGFVTRGSIALAHSRAMANGRPKTVSRYLLLAPRGYQWSTGPLKKLERSALVTRTSIVRPLR